MQTGYLRLLTCLLYGSTTFLSQAVSLPGCGVDFLLGGRVPQAVLLKADSLLKPANTTDFPAVAMNWPKNGSCVAQNRRMSYQLSGVSGFAVCFSSMVCDGIFKNGAFNRD